MDTYFTGSVIINFGDAFKVLCTCHMVCSSKYMNYTACEYAVNIKCNRRCHFLVEEAENERMHLLTALVLKQPGLIFRLSVLGTQGACLNCTLIFSVNRFRWSHDSIKFYLVVGCIFCCRNICYSLCNTVCHQSKVLP